MQPQKVLSLHKELTKKKPDISYPYMMSLKEDGWYSSIEFIPEKGYQHILSSAGREIPSLAHTTELFNLSLNFKLPHTIIMESVIPGIDFHEMNGLFNRTKNILPLKQTVFKVHDIVFPEKPDLSALERYELLKTFKSHLEKTGQIILQPLLGIAHEPNVWFQEANKAWEMGEEGIVLKRIGDIYKPGKRDASLMKIKLEKTFDLLCIRMYKTMGEKGNENLNLDLKNLRGIIVSVRIGKHSDIASFELNSPVGKVIEIKCMCDLPDGSYREPRFSRVRFDKKSSDIS